ncbi:CP20C [Hepatospora eriocheir]|uniref:Peptidyl-prolyl cis-trans isomerase n=1 Tax=Hepatospora eriocheir TaxID=1081669 RepID=A0A1X0Q9U6_9MICR|nr:CP20C [Hepatospora eriocheir]
MILLILIRSVLSLATSKSKKQNNSLVDSVINSDALLRIEYGTSDNLKVSDVEIELFWEKVPLTCANFANLCKGIDIRGKHYSYNGMIFHRIIEDFMMQGGDIVNQNGTGSINIFGDNRFEDENFSVKHDSIGCVSMANAGPNTNGSQFFITFKQTSWLDSRHVVFGKVKKEFIPVINEINYLANKFKNKLKVVCVNSSLIMKEKLSNEKHISESNNEVL